MNSDKTITFQDTLEWATSEDLRRETRSRSIPIFYLIIGAFIIFALVVLIIYLTSKNNYTEMDALEMMKDEKYTYDGDEYDGSYDEDVLNNPKTNDNINDHNNMELEGSYNQNDLINSDNNYIDEPFDLERED